MENLVTNFVVSTIASLLHTCNFLLVYECVYKRFPKCKRAYPDITLTDNDTMTQGWLFPLEIILTSKTDELRQALSAHTGL